MTGYKSGFALKGTEMSEALFINVRDDASTESHDAANNTSKRAITRHTGGDTPNSAHQAPPSSTQPAAILVTDRVTDRGIHTASQHGTPSGANTDVSTAETPDHAAAAPSDTMVFMNTPGKKATIRDVARLAGVSYGTVSRYLNGSAHVSGDAAQRIAAAIKEAQYTPNNAARSLAQRRTLTVALIIQVESRETIVQASVSAAMAGANQVLGDAGYQMVTVIANSEDSTQRIAQLVQSDFADGYLLFSLSNDTSLEQTFLTTQRPVVGSEINESNQVKFPTVDFTNEEGQRSITQYLLNRGRTNLLYVCGPGYSPSSLNRLRGFRAALGEHYRDENVYYADDWEITSGEMAVIAFQSKLDTADGIICANDNIAVGVINQLNRLGYRVPEDIAVTGFDDSPMAMLANPKLTTVRQDSELHGMTMAKLLLEMMSGKSVDRSHTVMLPTSIIERQSA